jgi:hypothetical protein
LLHFVIMARTLPQHIIDKACKNFVKSKLPKITTWAVIDCIPGARFIKSFASQELISSSDSNDREYGTAHLPKVPPQFQKHAIVEITIIDQNKDTVCTECSKIHLGAKSKILCVDCRKPRNKKILYTLFDYTDSRSREHSVNLTGWVNHKEYKSSLLMNVDLRKYFSHFVSDCLWFESILDMTYYMFAYKKPVYMVMRYCLDTSNITTSKNGQYTPHTAENMQRMKDIVQSVYIDDSISNPGYIEYPIQYIPRAIHHCDNPYDTWERAEILAQIDEHFKIYEQSDHDSNRKSVSVASLAYVFEDI